MQKITKITKNHSYEFTLLAPNDFGESRYFTRFLQKPSPSNKSALGLQSYRSTLLGEGFQVYAEEAQLQTLAERFEARGLCPKPPEIRTKLSGTSVFWYSPRGHKDEGTYLVATLPAFEKYKQHFGAHTDPNCRYSLLATFDGHNDAVGDALDRLCTHQRSAQLTNLSLMEVI